MNRYARTSPGQTLEIISIERPYSFFNLIAARFSDCKPLRRLFSQARMHQGRTMVIETLGTPEDLREENEDLRAHNPDLASSTAHRLSFFTRKFTTRRGLASTTDRDFLGYMVVKKDVAPSLGKILRIYESVLRPPRGRRATPRRRSEGEVCLLLRSLNAQPSTCLQFISRVRLIG